MPASRPTSARFFTAHRPRCTPKPTNSSSLSMKSSDRPASSHGGTKQTMPTSRAMPADPRDRGAAARASRPRRSSSATHQATTRSADDARHPMARPNSTPARTCRLAPGAAPPSVQLIDGAGYDSTRGPRLLTARSIGGTCRDAARRGEADGTSAHPPSATVARSAREDRTGQQEAEGPHEVPERGGRDPEPRVARQHEHRPLGPAPSVALHEHVHAPQRERREADAGQVDQHRAAKVVEQADAQLVHCGARASGHLVAAVVDPRPTRSQHVGHVQVGAVAEQRERQVHEHAQRPPRGRVWRARKELRPPSPAVLGPCGRDDVLPSARPARAARRRAASGSPWRSGARRGLPGRRRTRPPRHTHATQPPPPPRRRGGGRSPVRDAPSRPRGRRARARPAPTSPTRPPPPVRCGTP